MTTPTEPQQNPESRTVMKFGDLKQMMRNIVQEVVGNQPQDPEPRRSPIQRGQQQPRGRSVDDEVRTAVEKLEKDRKDREAREARDKQLDTDINDLKERTKEKPPVERRRVHRVMGWGD